MIFLDSQLYKIQCTKESLPGRWHGDLTRGFTLFDVLQNQNWDCTCHHFRFKDFWLCHDESCGPMCQKNLFETYQPVTEGCCKS